MGAGMERGGVASGPPVEEERREEGLWGPADELASDDDAAPLALALDVPAPACDDDAQAASGAQLGINTATSPSSSWLPLLLLLLPVPVRRLLPVEVRLPVDDLLLDRVLRLTLALARIELSSPLALAMLESPVPPCVDGAAE